MVQIILDGTGISKSGLVEGAYDYCGLNASEFERTPEEMTTGLRHLNALVSSLLAKGIDLGFDFPTYGQGLLEEPSGIPDSAQQPVMALLAQRLAPSLGAALSDDVKAIIGTAVQDLYAQYAKTPPARVPAYRLTTSGVRHTNLLAASTATATSTS